MAASLELSGLWSFIARTKEHKRLVLARLAEDLLVAGPSCASPDLVSRISSSWFCFSSFLRNITSVASPDYAPSIGNRQLWFFYCRAYIHLFPPDDMSPATLAKLAPEAAM